MRAVSAIKDWLPRDVEASDHTPRDVVVLDDTTHPSTKERVK